MKRIDFGRLALASTSILAIGVSLAAAQSIDTEIGVGNPTTTLQGYGDSNPVEQHNIGNETATIANQGQLPVDFITITGVISPDALQDVSKNAADATAIGNIGDSAIDDETLLALGGAGIGSVQLNFDNAILASINTVSVGGFVAIDSGDAFTDTFTVRGNSLDSVAVGNQSLASFDYENVSVLGSSTFAGVTLTVDGSSPDLEGDLDAHLGILSAQGNAGVTIDGTLHNVAAGIMFATGENAEGANLVVGDNALSASSSGNVGTLAIQVKTDANFNASASIGNQQANYASGITTEVGQTDFQTTGPVALGITVGNIEDSTAVTSGNSVSGLAVGNQGAAGIAIAATDLRGDLGLAYALIDFDDYEVTAQGTASVANQQVNYETQILATVAGIAMGVTSVGDTISGSTVVASDNSIQSGARGNVGSNGIGLTAVAGGAESASGYGTLNAAVSSGQYSGSLVLASLSESQVGISSTAGADVSGSVLALSDNRMQATAIANSVINSLSAEVADALVGTVDGIPGNLLPIVDYEGTNAAFALANGQWYEGDVMATNTASNIGTAEVESISDGSVLVISGNIIGALARGNVALGDGNVYGNNIEIDIASLDTPTGGGDNIVSLLSVQENGASIGASTMVARIGTNDDDLAISDSTATTAGNLVYAIAEGSLAENRIRFTGVSYEGGYPTATQAITGTGDVDREFSLLNVQRETDEFSRYVNAGVSNFSIDLDMTELSDSVATVSDNTVQALARDNNAVNVLEISGFANLTTTGAVVNEQSTSAIIGASIDSGGDSALINIEADQTIDASTLVVSGNLMDARAEGNRATNALVVSAVNLGSSVGSTIGYASGQPQVATAQSDYAVLNSQTNLGPLNASVTSAFAGVTGDNAAAVTNSLSAVTGNQVRATGVANAAFNQIALASAAVAGASAAIATTQHNAGSVTATVSDVVMGIMGAASATGSINVVRGNSISAAAVGNSVTNRISRSGY